MKKNSTKKTFVIVGCNKQNGFVLKSINYEENSAMLLCQKDDTITDVAPILQGIKAELSLDFDIKLALKKLLGDEKVSLCVVVNTGTDSNNLVYAEAIKELIDEMELSEDKISCYVFLEPENASGLEKIEKETCGKIRYVDKYKLLALDFVDKYPLTKYMDSSEIDYSTATINNDVQINVVMVGFEKGNRQLFFTSATNNQFLTLKKDKLVEKKVNYFIYSDEKRSKVLDYEFFKFAKNRFSMRLKRSKYLPLPPKPVNEKILKRDINTTKLLKSIVKNISNPKPMLSYSYVIVDFASDWENLELAKNLLFALKSNDLLKNTKIFVKITENELLNKFKNAEYIKDNSFVIYGNEEKIVYNIAQITDEKQQRMALLRHFCYLTDDKMSDSEKKTIVQNEIQKFYNLERIQRESNIYAVLSIRSKLQLLGFDYCENEEIIESAEVDFIKAYEFKREKSVNLNDIVPYNVRDIFAVQEHLRWNAYMISCGFIPSTKKQIMEEGAKNFAQKRHGNITTFEGLVEFKKMMAELSGKSEEKFDVIKLDYQIMDDVTLILNKNGYKIIKKSK